MCFTNVETWRLFTDRPFRCHLLYGLWGKIRTATIGKQLASNTWETYLRKLRALRSNVKFSILIQVSGRFDEKKISLCEYSRKQRKKRIFIVSRFLFFIPHACFVRTPMCHKIKTNVRFWIFAVIFLTVLIENKKKIRVARTKKKQPWIETRKQLLIVTKKSQECYSRYGSK